MKVILNETLHQKGISQYQLSKIIGITPANLNNLCNNKTTSIKFSILDKICEALDCNVSDILQYEKNNISE